MWYEDCTQIVFLEPWLYDDKLTELSNGYKKHTALKKKQIERELL